MKVFKTFVGSAVVASMLWSQLALAITDEMRDLVLYETKANAVATRSNEKKVIHHYEIPLKILESDLKIDANAGYVKALTFERDGEKYVRWVLNPEDTRWEKAVRVFLLRNGIEPVKKAYFEGYMTASRSYILVDPVTGAEFSLKTSTNRTGGYWADKKQTWDDASQIRKISDYVIERLKSQPPLQHSIVLDEPIAFGIKRFDMGMIVRSYEELPGTGKRYVPGFSIMHEKLGRELAKANGSSDPATYWNENYNKPLARALAEFFVATGIRYDSPHSQNFLVELDERNKPTGKIVLRDFGDSYLYEKFFKAIKRTDIIDIWEKGNIMRGDMGMTVGILHGNKPPSWIDYRNDKSSADSYDKWGRDFFAEFEAEVKRQTGVDIPARTVIDRSIYEDPETKVKHKMGYFTRDYSLLSADNGFLKMVSKDQQREVGAARLCGRVFNH